MELTTHCLECLLRRNLDTARKLGDEATAMAFAREFLAAILAAPQGVTTPYFSPITADLFQKYYGLEPDRFRREKRESNEFVLARLERIRESVAGAEDPVYAGMQCAVLGNYLDFSALRDQVDFGVLEGLLEKSREIRLDVEAYRRFRQDLAQAQRLLYLTDNAGEIGFDRIFAEAIANAYPQLAITFCVRGGPTLNDATREDAQCVGIPFPVIDNGNCIPGTLPELLSAEASDALHTADVILSKGMANAETLLGSGYPVYYALLVKCQRFSAVFGKPLMTPVLAAEQQGGTL